MSMGAYRVWAPCAEHVELHLEAPSSHLDQRGEASHLDQRGLRCDGGASKPGVGGVLPSAASRGDP